MGFSSALQGRAAHEALIVRQDAELRLMETMKRSIQMKAKCDKEYAISLAAVAQQGLKIDRADELQGSLITKSWRSYMDELDQQAKQFKSNAELLEVVCEKISHLSQDKRKARKAYQEEHAKIAARLNHLTDEVVRKKTEYQKHLEGYKALRTRFEEHYIKSGRGGRKLDDVRDKYQKACRKLHLTHNEYVLSITEAIEVEKDFRTVLLPGLLEHQQSVQESFILLWKNLLQEASQHSDLTSDKFKEIQKRIDNVINNINPSEEYREFTEKHKTSPTSPLVFQFDESLIEDIPGKLQSSTLTVDNLTVDWLRSRLIDLEISVKECQEKQLKMIEHVNGGSPIANGSITTNGNGNGNGSTNSNTSTNGGTQSNKDSQNRQSKDLNALRCQEKQKQKLVDMIKCALNEVGCEELPSGCDDHLTLDQNFIENGFNNDQQTSNASTTSASVSIMNELMRRGGVLTLLRGKHFKRKSTPQPTTPNARTRAQRLNSAKLQPRSQSLGSLSVNTSPARYEPITNPLRMAASMEANNNRGLHDIIDFEESVIMLEREAATLRKLRKLRCTTHNSMLCVSEEEAAVLSSFNNPAVLTPAPASMLDTKSDSYAYNNNNNIYADLEYVGGIEQSTATGDGESVKSGELAVKLQPNVKIEINRVDSGKERDSGANKSKVELEANLELKSIENKLEARPKETTPLAKDVSPQPKSASVLRKSPSPIQKSASHILKSASPLPKSTSPLLKAAVTKTVSARMPLDEPMQNSIDAHLDKIDAINRALDDRLKRNLPIQQPPKLDFDAIESAESTITTVLVARRSKQTEEDSDMHSSSKRTSSSSSDYRPNLSGCKDKDTANSTNKKRSLSFSQKSINAILTNIKEFSKSPLQRKQKSNNITLLEYRERIDGIEEPTGESKSSDATTQNESIATDSKQLNAMNSSATTVTTNPPTSDTQTPPPSISNNNKSNNTTTNSNTNSNSANTTTNTTTNTTINTTTNTTTTNKTITSSIVASSNPSKDNINSTASSKLKFKVPKIQKKSKAIRQTFRSKLINFQIRRGKLCKTCTKRRRIHPSKSVFDFAKEFNMNNDCGGDEFCTCSAVIVPPGTAVKITNSSTNTEHPFESTSSADAEDEESSDDVLSMKDHCYCVPSLSTSVSN